MMIIITMKIRSVAILAQVHGRALGSRCILGVASPLKHRNSAAVAHSLATSPSRPGLMITVLMPKTKWMLTVMLIASAGWLMTADAMVSPQMLR